MGKPPGGFNDFKDLLDSTGLGESDKALIVSRISEHEKSRLLNGVTRKEYENLAKSLMYEAPGGPSSEKLKTLQISVQNALEKANLMKAAVIEKKAAEAQEENAELAARMIGSKGKLGKGVGKPKADKTVIEDGEAMPQADSSRGKESTGASGSNFQRQTKRPASLSDADASADEVEADKLAKRAKLAEKQKELKNNAEVKSESAASVKIGANTIEFEHVQTVTSMSSKGYEAKPLGQISSLRSTHSIIKSTVSGRQQGRLNISAVRNDSWLAGERTNCWYSDDRTFFCVEMSSTYEHASITSGWTSVRIACYDKKGILSFEL